MVRLPGCFYSEYVRKQPEEVIRAHSKVASHACAVRLHALPLTPLQLRTVDGCVVVLVE